MDYIFNLPIPRLNVIAISFIFIMTPSNIGSHSFYILYRIFVLLQVTCLIGIGI